jgi:hypothetical protein
MNEQGMSRANQPGVLVFGTGVEGSFPPLPETGPPPSFDTGFRLTTIAPVISL